MATVNEKLLSEIVAHEIEVLGYGNFLTKKIVNILNKSDENIFAKLNKIIDELPSKSINVKKVDRLLQPIVKANNKAYSEARLELQNEMQEFVNQEVDFQTEIVNKESPAKIKTISPEQVYSAALAKPFQGELLSEFFSKLSSQKQTLINNTVRMGLIEGKSTNEIVKQIRGTKQLQFKDGILAITRRNAESVVLTSLAHFQNFAQESLYDANNDIIKGFRYTSTLDTRTTELCASRDGNYYEIDAAKPAIPAHYRCRSRYVPVLKSFRELGLDADEFTPSTRASMDGQVPNKLTYSDWLSGQSVDRQNKVLGIEKAKLFRDGGLTLDKFVNPAGNVYTLAELKILNAKQYYLGQSIALADLSKLPVKNQNILRGMYEKAAQNKNDFDGVNKSIASAVDGVLKTTKLKESKRTVEKILSDYKGDPTQVKDLLRTTIEVKSLEDVDSVINDITAKYGAPVKLRNSLNVNSKSRDGYRDVNMVIQYKGSLAEVQINIRDMLEAKSVLHKEYEVVRTLRAIEETKKRALTIAEQTQLNMALDKMEKGYNSAWDKALRKK